MLNNICWSISQIAVFSTLRSFGNSDFWAFCAFWGVAPLKQRLFY